MRPERFEVVSVIDPALDTESMTVAEMLEYTETRDIKLVKHRVRPGQRLTVYHVRAVPHALWQSYVAAAGDNEELRVRRAFQCGLERVENLYGNDGVSLDSWEPAGRSSNPNAIMKDDELNQCFAPSDVLEIGSVIYKHSFFPRRTEARYALLSSLEEPLFRRAFRRADQSPRSASETSSSPQSSTEPPTATGSR